MAAIEASAPPGDYGIWHAFKQCKNHTALAVNGFLVTSGILLILAAHYTAPQGTNSLTQIGSACEAIGYCTLLLGVFSSLMRLSQSKSRNALDGEWHQLSHGWFVEGSMGDILIISPDLNPRSIKEICLNQANSIIINNYLEKADVESITKYLLRYAIQENHEIAFVFLTKRRVVDQLIITTQKFLKPTEWDIPSHTLDPIVKRNVREIYIIFTAAVMRIPYPLLTTHTHSSQTRVSSAHRSLPFDPTYV